MSGVFGFKTSLFAEKIFELCTGINDRIYKSTTLLNNFEARTYRQFTLNQEAECVYKVSDGIYLVKMINQSACKGDFFLDFKTGNKFMLISISSEYEDGNIYDITVQSLLFSRSIRYLLEFHGVDKLFGNIDLAIAMIGIMYGIKNRHGDVFNVEVFLDNFDESIKERANSFLEQDEFINAFNDSDYDDVLNFFQGED